MGRSSRENQGNLWAPGFPGGTFSRSFCSVWSNWFYHNMKEEFEKLGLLYWYGFCPKEYRPFQTVFISTPTDNKWLPQFSSHSAVEPSFMYQRRKKVDVPAKHLYVSTMKMQVSLTLEQLSWMRVQVFYVEGCTTSTYSTIASMQRLLNLCMDGAYMRYTTIQNWSDNVTTWSPSGPKLKRCHSWVDRQRQNSRQPWVPICLSLEEGARGTMLSIAFANAGQHQDTGVRWSTMPHTKSSIVSNPIMKGGGKITVDK